MRIGLDMLPVQSPENRDRGIGRYSHHFAKALIAHSDHHEFILYTHKGLPVERIPRGANVAVREVTPDRDFGDSTVAHRLDRLIRQNSDRLDAYLVLSPFESWAGYSPPARWPGGPAIVSVLYDLIPLIFQDVYYSDPGVRLWYERALWTVRQYDLLLAISEATRLDCLARLGLPDARVVTIGTATDSAFFYPDDSEPIPATTHEALRKLGVKLPYFLCVSGCDVRKNLGGLVDAFARLPEPIRRMYQLVIACKTWDQYIEPLKHKAESLGIRDALCFTDEVTDDELRVLYQRCAAFVFPSLYEGFGLPLLEALHCGAVVIAGDNSSQPEVVGDAGLLVNASDSASVAAAMTRAVQDPTLIAKLKSKSSDQAARFSWSHVAERALDVLTDHVVMRRRAANPRRAQGRKAKRRVAFFSPFPPAPSGIADYSDALIAELQSSYVIDRYHEVGFIPDPAWSREGALSADARLFPRIAPFREYCGVIYQMGNSSLHNFLYPHLLTYPGVTTLHEVSLAAFQFTRGRTFGSLHDHLVNELAFEGSRQRAELLARFHKYQSNAELFSAVCAELEIDLCGRILDRSTAVVVHSSSNLDHLTRRYPDLADKVTVVPHGVHPRPLSHEERALLRERFSIPTSARLLVALGIVHPSKLNIPALDAFAQIADTFPDAILIFAGEEFDASRLRNRVAELNLTHRVRVLGRVPAADYQDLAACADIGVNLRQPPTRGESSASLLDLLRHGVAACVTNVGTFADYPDEVVFKVDWTSDAVGCQRLKSAIAELLSNPYRRERFGRAALAYVKRERSWPHVAGLYRRVIEYCHAERSIVAA
jgi:glycosyltransferase involved in cell wall biosynthesis